MNNKNIFAYSFVVAAFVLSNVTSVFAQQSTPPSFPSCNGLRDGDWVSVDSGTHHIPGQEATISGSDDVYQLENQDFLQCLCADDDSQTTRTVWWNITGLELSQEEIDSYLADGWYREDGGSWNLIQGNTYLAKNYSYSCQETTPTPTPGDELARCTGIEANPSEGTAALYVKFAAAGYDSEGEIKEYRFDFGDNSDTQPERINTEYPEGTHVYTYPGTYKASVQVKDSRGVWHGGNSECEIEITVKDVPQVQSSDPITSLPDTGVPFSFLIGSIMTAGAGITLYRRSRLV